MDANGTRYHLLLGKDDWGTCVDDQGRSLRSLWETSADSGSPPSPSMSPVSEPQIGELAWNSERNELTLQPRLFQFVASPSDRPPKPDDRRGAGRDRYGNWYWIDETRRKIRVTSTVSGATSDYWPAASEGDRPAARQGEFRPRDSQAPPEPLTFGGLAVTEDHYLVAGVLQPAGLLIFDLHAGGPPQQMYWPQAIDFVPFDMAPRPGGGVWILDRENARYWV